MSVQETLGMWWAKIIIPIAFSILTGCFVYFYHHEVRTDQIELDLALLKAQTAKNELETKEYLDVLKVIADGTQSNKEEIISLRVRTDAIIERNNQMIEALISKAKETK